MIQHHFNYRHQSRVHDPTEALQTDVMRFMAIICMCLMVIFSLVQSMPIHNKNNQPDLKLTGIVQPEPKPMVEILKKEKTIVSVVIPEPMQRQKQNPKPTVKPVAKSMVKQVLKPVQKQISGEILVQSETEQKRGFSLGFVSNDALEYLLNDPTKVKLYLFASNRCWKLNVKEGRILKFLLSDPPGKVYDMEMETVPENIQHAAAQVVATFGRDQVSYGVHLSRDMQEQIILLMSELQAGDLVILKNGEIEVAP